VYEGLAEASVDAAIFDLPQPWDAVRIAAPLIRPGGRLCTFSPCIEQISRTIDILPECGFTQHEARTHY
jgi:tRNA (adenine57-N1/adenine58-N1)-methyltransferase